MPTSSTGNVQFIPNGGFEQGLANWTVGPYDEALAPFDFGTTNDALEGCIAL
jgi:hypothetical protein